MYAQNTLALLLLFIVSQVTSNGVFKLELLQFNNDNGLLATNSCCSGQLRDQVCTEPCATHFRICFKHFENVINPDSCSFGEFTTEVLGNNSFIFPEKKGPFTNPLEFPFTFEWRGDFSLIIEAHHESGVQDQELIARFMSATSTVPSDGVKTVQWNTTSQALRLKYSVECTGNYYGDKCQQQCTPRDDQLGHWTCAPNGEKVCRQGYSGEFCDKAICLEGCHSEHGSCDHPNECSCRAGWTGRHCDECVTYPGCTHGTCNLPFQCICKDGWGGMYCNQDLNFCTNQRPCKNGGTCSNSGAGQYTCSCPLGYTGTNCETEVDNCQVRPCQNGGTCTDIGNDFICTCPTGYAGSRCDISASRCEENPCAHGGSCEPVGSSYRCNCAPGWTGVNCQSQYDDCLSQPCLNGGQCVDEQNDFRCICPTGYSGELCQVNKNYCVGEEDRCLNGGECVDKDDSFECKCRAGYIGAVCEINVDDCITLPCANGGTCTDGENSFTCQCAPGFTGHMCNEQINECAGEPCQNGGSCVDLINDFECMCNDGYTGQTCQYEKGQEPSSTTRVIPSTTKSTTTTPENRAGVVGETRQQEQEDRTEVVLTTQQLIIVVCLGSGIPLVLLLVLVSLLLYRRCKKSARQDKEECRQNEINSMNNRVSNNLHSDKEAALNSSCKKGQDYPTAAKISNEIEISMNQVKPGQHNVAIVLPNKLVNKELIKDINTVREKQQRNTLPSMTDASGQMSAELYQQYYQQQQQQRQCTAKSTNRGSIYSMENAAMVNSNDSAVDDNHHSHSTCAHISSSQPSTNERMPAVGELDESSIDFLYGEANRQSNYSATEV